MAITFHQDYFRNSAGVKWQIIGKFDLDASYPAGGYLIDPVQIGLSQIDSVVVNDAAFGYEYNWDKVNSKLLVYESGGGGGGGIFVGTPAILTGNNNPSAVTGTADPQTWAGNPLPPHTHNLQVNTETANYTRWRIYYNGLVGGPFVVGETVTDAFANNGVILALGTLDGNAYLDFSSVSGILGFGVTITGGTSGATATSLTPTLGIFTPAFTPFFIVNALATEPVNPSQVGYSPVPNSTLMFGNVVSWIIRINSAGEIEGTLDQIDGAQVTGYSVTYAFEALTSASAGTPTGANLASAINGTAAAQILNMNSYTPTGIIMGGGGGGAPQAEVAGGTNLSTVINVEFISFGL